MLVKISLPFTTNLAVPIRHTIAKRANTHSAKTKKPITSGTKMIWQVSAINCPATPQRATANLILPQQQIIISKTMAAIPKVIYPKML